MTKTEAINPLVEALIEAQKYKTPEAKEQTAEAIRTLADLAYGDSGGSWAARSVLLNAWNRDNPIRGIHLLSSRFRKAAICIIDRPDAIDDEVIERLVPRIRQWQIEVEIEQETS